MDTTTPPESDAFHANSSCPRGTVLLSPEVLQRYVDAGEDMPLTIYFNGEWPSVSFVVGMDAIAHGDVPVNPTLIQKHMYLAGNRYWSRWVGDGSRSTSNNISKNTVIAISAFGAVLLVVLAAVMFHRRRSRAQ